MVKFFPLGPVVCTILSLCPAAVNEKIPYMSMAGGNYYASIFFQPRVITLQLNIGANMRIPERAVAVQWTF